MRIAAREQGFDAFPLPRQTYYRGREHLEDKTVLPSADASPQGPPRGTRKDLS